MAVLWIVDSNSPREGLALVPADSAQNIVAHVGSGFAAATRRRVTTPVRLVRIVSHGNAGELLLSVGTIGESQVGNFQFLRGLSSPPPLCPGIEIHGCGVASAFLPPPVREPGIGGAYTLNYGNMRGELTTLPHNSDVLAGGMASSSVTTAIRASKGVRFLQAMANLCGVGVKGAVDYQHPDAQWQYEGPTITVFPSRLQPGLLHDPDNRYGMGTTVLF